MLQDAICLRVRQSFCLLHTGTLSKRIIIAFHYLHLVKFGRLSLTRSKHRWRVENMRRD